MKNFKSTLATMVAAATVLLTSCGGGAGKADAGALAGAGATFPLPFYNMAFKAYGDTTGTNVTYGGVGSGGGIRSLKDRTVDFAGSDAYLSEKEMSEMPGKVLHIPSCMGAVVMAYNLEGVNNLVLDGATIADIYMGNITKWNDERIAALNPEVKLPDLKINPVYRSDGSGTTFVFSDYLTKVSTDWASKLGTGKSLKWPVGVASKGNPGVAGTIKETPASIGYVGSEYAFAQKIPTAKLKNAAGNVVEASLASISASATGEIPADMRVMITNSAAVDAYPISCFTWLLVYADQSYDGRTKEQAAQTVKMLKWMMSKDAQDMTTKVHYAPLPASLVQTAISTLDGVTFAGEKL